MRAIKRQIDGALGSRGAWLLAPYDDKPDSSGAEYRRSGRHPQDRGAGHPARLPALRARHRRPGQPRGSEHLRAGVSRASRQEEFAVAHRTRAAPERGGHSALRQAGRDRGDAGDALHFGRALCAAAAGSEAGRGGRVCLAEADEVGRHCGQRDGCAGGRCEPAGVVLRVGKPQAEGRVGVLSATSG